MGKKYLVIGDFVTSKNDGEKHFVSAKRLCELYGVNPRECILTSEEAIKRSLIIASLPKDVTVLRPRYDGDYTL